MPTSPIPEKSRTFPFSALGGLSLGARNLLAATVSYLLIAACVTIMWRNLTVLTDTQKWVAHTNQVVLTTNAAMAALVDMETGARGFAVGGKAEFLEPFESGKVAFGRMIEAGQTLVSDNPAQVQRFQKLSEAGRTWVEGPVAQDIAGRRAVAAGEMDEKAFVASFNQATGKKNMDEMRAMVAEIIAIENNLMERRNADYAKAVSASRFWGSWIIGGVIVAGWLMIFQIGRGAQQVLKRVSKTLGEASDQVSASAGEVSSASQMLAQGASEQAASLEETSASIEEINSQAKRNGDNANDARGLAQEAREATDQGTAQMREMVDAMDAIKTSSNNIAKIVKTIDEIAFQTNILALNAAVEAARAGEAGAGFAVVADEVRNLAQRAALAAKETTESIDDSIRKSARGAELSSKVAQDLDRIAGKARQVADLVVEIATASREQSEGLGQVGTAMSQMDKVTQANAGSAEETAASAEELKSQASVLESAVGELVRLIGGYSTK